MPRNSAEKLHALTALRFFAAAMIVIHHSAGGIPFAQSLTNQFNFVEAVSFFFVLSGFILTYVYPSLDSWNARLTFLRPRFARVWPGHLVGFALVWIICRTPANFPTGYASFPLAVANLSLVHAWFPIARICSSFNAVSWTISTEFAFYLLFPLLVHRLDKTWWWKLLFTLGLAVGAVLFTILANVPPNDPAHPWAICSGGIIYENPVSRLFEFSLGMATALLFRRTVSLHRLRPATATGLELAAIALAFTNMHFAPDIARLLLGNSPALAYIRELLVLGPLSCFSFAALIYIMARGEGALSRLLSRPFPVLLGEISYSLYILHILLLGYYFQHVHPAPGWPTYLSYALFFLCLLVVSWLAWTVVERPMRRWIVKGLTWSRPSATSESTMATSGTTGQG